MNPESKIQLDVLWLGLAVATLRVILEALPPPEHLLILGLLPPVLAVLTLALALPLALSVWWGRIMPGICLFAVSVYALLSGVSLSALLLAMAIGMVAGFLLGLLWQRRPQTSIAAPFLILAGLLLPASPILTISCPPLTAVGFVFVTTTWILTSSLVIPQPRLARAVRISAYACWVGCGWYVIPATRSAMSPSVSPVGWLIALVVSVAAIVVAYFVERLLAPGLCPLLPGWQTGGWVEQLGAARQAWSSQRFDRVLRQLNALNDTDRLAFIERLVQAHIASAHVPNQHRIRLNEYLTNLARRADLSNLQRLAVQCARLNPRRGINGVVASWIAGLAIWYWSQFDEMMADLAATIPAQDSEANRLAAYALKKLPDTLPAADQRFARLLIWYGHLHRVAPAGWTQKTLSLLASQAKGVDHWVTKWADRNRRYYRFNNAFDSAWKEQGAALLSLTHGPTVVSVLAEEARAVHQAEHTLAALDMLVFVESKFPHHTADALVHALRTRIEGDFLENQGWLDPGSLRLSQPQSLLDARRVRFENQSDAQSLTLLLLGPDSCRLELAAGKAASLTLRPGDYSLLVYSDTAETKAYRCAWAVTPGAAQQAQLLLS
jgi:hypothetical protein